jgi:aspartate/methionine/tyrosine aminotransferase
VIVETPCYESALQIARSTGAEVSQWRRRYEDGWAHDLDALAGLIRPATRLLYLNQPHNPTGTLMARPVFEHVIGLARAHGLVVFSDEVYRELEHDPASRLPAAPARKQTQAVRTATSAGPASTAAWSWITLC